MSYIVSMPPPEAGGPEMMGVQYRSESVVFTRRYTDYPPETDPEMFADGTPTYTVEIGKGFLAEMLAFFDNPANRALCGVTVPAPFPTGE